MKLDAKNYYTMPQRLMERLNKRGYKQITWQQQMEFDPYYDMMNGHWCANTSFLNLWGWHDTFTAYYKKTDEYIYIIQYLWSDGYPVAAPCLGNYTKDGIEKVIRELREDFEFFGYPLVFMDITPWMLPYFTEAGIDFSIEDLRELQDYVFTPDEFVEGMDQSDDRYRYRYFKRRYNYETLVLSSEYADECAEFMDKNWCVNRECDGCCGCLKQVLFNVISKFDSVRCYGILVRVDGDMAGLCIVTNRNGLGVYQYKNAINRIKGINEYLLRESYERFMQGVDMINYTEDMGIESLRYYKEHLAPNYSLLSKYTLREKV